MYDLSVSPVKKGAVSQGSKGPGEQRGKNTHNSPAGARWWQDTHNIFMCGNFFIQHESSNILFVKYGVFISFQYTFVGIIKKLYS